MIGFNSENSEDEDTRYRREERFYMREMQKKHGKNIFLRKRPIKPFEKLLLKFGGSDILRQQLGKSSNVNPENVKMVYEWVDPLTQPFRNFGDFLMAQTQEEADEIYANEKECQ